MRALKLAAAAALAAGVLSACGSQCPPGYSAGGDECYPNNPQQQGPGFGGDDDDYEEWDD